MPHLIANDILIPEMAALLQEGHQVRFTPSGVSMRPFIEGGKDSVVLERKPRYRVGDIVLMQLPTTYVLHRLIAVDGDRVTLRGDGNLYGVEQGTQADILGYVTEIRSPKGCRKIICKGRVWHVLFPVRGFLLKVYPPFHLPLRAFEISNPRFLEKSNLRKIEKITKYYASKTRFQIASAGQ